MSCTNYRVIEMQNTGIGQVANNAFMPFGRVTRRISTSSGNGVPFQVTNSKADTIQLTNKGYYKVLYNATITVGGAGDITLVLLANGTPVYSITHHATAAGNYNLTLPKEVKVFANCASCTTNCPMDIQILNAGQAITGGTSNIIIDSCVNG